MKILSLQYGNKQLSLQINSFLECAFDDHTHVNNFLNTWKYCGTLWPCNHACPINNTTKKFRFLFCHACINYYTKHQETAVQSSQKAKYKFKNTTSSTNLYH